ncbi:regulator of nucleoside diphosphate kinase [Zhouia amylolytica]|uniref:GreA/GreB family elongation factor n=2 Tax=Zhouia amylolytica TaxID=376730 RepID=W2UQP1_9FLAO|nr:GreA/GreB family elongation factor [Zhouia amylolytica]ETN96485.1 greA/GreB family elongation factor [Zhouia amylolytica AD3]MCQ0110026.1 GreA/GreB family elongation factor [Zhouia amylolytica]SFT08800.1 regulator of nucleoside diphosphate kinase [Zhouia amylolytica]
MKYEGIVIEKKEFVILKRLLNTAGYGQEDARGKSIYRLKQELTTALVYSEEFMPEDVIRFNSVITVASTDGWQKQFTLVMPSDGDFKTNKVSILTPMGAAVIGYAKGDIIDWEFPGGSKQITITEVKQPSGFIDANIIL